ncbi:luciferin sulfotransferase-like [Toxorhynchites rutilus septentrionalis]|uniref:luciferin sulfotransferase-like n=1 Tax=Toxorhynchites rutilus septentrionalis TaxID=329112 RepID=UPI00247A7527|nr:luciferin sulfotransferase-like [Toxorhynchites rutilus septentrionalis]XP_055621719.1 luciferin sulfotransferase-like [Toxorhynchites rutilus septentrionalis]XP_055621720.1 luciferin sulfotransferase-like [Toxorhynchites rutilus septentrionalis]XP_055621721.1 luciferin sulfotransferase-like [Toxorhynchites rutilus septentrionalis]
MFRYKDLCQDNVKRFETPFNENFVEVHLTDVSVSPTGDRTWSPVHCILPKRYKHFAERIRNLTIYEDDVWIVTFPKAGTTWAQEMLWLIDHDLDYEKASSVNLQERSVFLEVFAFVTNIDLPDTIALVENMPRPRHIKTHLSLALLPKDLWIVKPKVVYVARNPKDVTISFMHHYKYMHGFKGSQQDFLDGILMDQLIYCPQVRHATEFWRVAKLHHVLFLHFEDMKRSMADVLEKVCKFFGKSFTAEELAHLENHLSFDVMKENKAANNQQLVESTTEAMGIPPHNHKFMRNGQVGTYQRELQREYLDKLDEFIAKQLGGTDFKYGI